MRLLAPSLLVLALVACARPVATPPAPPAQPGQPAQSAQPHQPVQPAPMTEAPMVSQPPPAELDQELPRFVPTLSIPEQGAITSIGSDSMDPLLQLWFDDFRSAYPAMRSILVSKGSATAPRALVAGTTLMGHMSREMNPDELGAFQARFGYPPTRIVVAMDALAIYVNANNPINRLSMEQIDAIYSKDRKGGYETSVNSWGDLGLTREWGTRAIQPYGRDENSGTRAFFKEHVLRKGEYKDIVQPEPDQFALVEAAAMDASAIAYGPIQHALRMVKAVPVIDFNGSKAILPTVQNVLNGKYPLARFLYIYVNIRPGQACDPLIKEFLRFVLSKQGQSDVANFGAIPLPGDLARVNLGKVR